MNTIVTKAEIIKKQKVDISNVHRGGGGSSSLAPPPEIFGQRFKSGVVDKNNVAPS